MKKKMLINLLLATYLLAIGSLCFGRTETRKIAPIKKAPVKVKPATVTKVEVKSASVASADVTPGAKPVTVTLTGSNLNLITSAVLVLDGWPVKGTKVTLGAANPTKRNVSFYADANTKANSNCQLRLTAGKQIINVSAKMLSLSIKTPRPTKTPTKPGIKPIRTSDRTYLPSLETLGKPNVTSWDRRGVLVSEQMRFSGENLQRSSFTVRVGSRELEVTDRSAPGGAVYAKAPNHRMNGPLIVGYGIPATEVTLQEDYRVYAPEIAAVRPGTFRRGTTVTVQGTDLAGLAPRHSNQGGYGNPSDFLKISYDSSDWGGNDFVGVTDFKVLENGDLSFQALGVYTLAPSMVPGVYQEPQPNQLAGQLWFSGLADGRDLLFNSPAPVYWQPGPNPVIAEIVAGWVRPVTGRNYFIDNDSLGLLSRDCVLVPLEGTWVRLNGQGLFHKYHPYITQATISDREMEKGFRYGIPGTELGTALWVRIPHGASHGPIILNRSDNTSVNSRNLRICNGPLWSAETRSMMGTKFNIQLNQLYTLTGSYVQSIGVQGLRYEFIIDGPAQANGEAFGITPRVIEHNSDMVKLEFEATENNQSRQENDSWRTGVLVMRAKYGNKHVLLWSCPYELVE